MVRFRVESRDLCLNYIMAIPITSVTPVKISELNPGVFSNDKNMLWIPASYNEDETRKYPATDIENSIKTVIEQNITQKLENQDENIERNREIASEEKSWQMQLQSLLKQYNSA